MKYRIKDIIDSVEYYDLLNLKKDLESGSHNIKKLLNQKIKEHEKQHEKSCSVCSNELDPYNTNNYTLIFGPEDFRKKASFCGLDCLEYFLVILKQIKRGGKNSD